MFAACVAATAETNALQDRRAVYGGSKFGIDIDYEVQIHRRAAGAPALQWMQLPGSIRAGTRAISSGDWWIHVRLKQRLLHSAVTSDSVLDPTQGRTLQRIVQRQRDSYVSYKVTQFGSAGLVLLRLRQDKSVQYPDWLQAKSSYRAYPDRLSDGSGVADPNALFYLLGSKTLQQAGGELQFPVFSDNQLLQVNMRARGVRTVEVALVARPNGAERRINGPREAQFVTIEARPLEPDAEDEDVTVLGMRGRINMLVDREWGVPLKISGQVPPVGEVELELERLEF